MAKRVVIPIQNNKLFSELIMLGEPRWYHVPVTSLHKGNKLWVFRLYYIKLAKIMDSYGLLSEPVAIHYEKKKDVVIEVHIDITTHEYRIRKGVE